MIALKLLGLTLGASVLTAILAPDFGADLLLAVVDLLS